MLNSSRHDANATRAIGGKRCPRTINGGAAATLSRKVGGGQLQWQSGVRPNVLLRNCLPAKLEQW